MRHLTDVERTWFRRRFHGEDAGARYWRSEAPDAAFDRADPARAEDDLAALVTEWAACRRAIADASLNATFTSELWGTMSLRWVYLHMIREYALHNGHADLLRERIDGRVA